MHVHVQVRCIVPESEFSEETHGPLGTGERVHVGPPQIHIGGPHGGPHGGVRECHGVMARRVTDGSLLHPGSAMAAIPPLIYLCDIAIDISMRQGGHIIELSNDAMDRWGLDNKLLEP